MHALPRDEERLQLGRRRHTVFLGQRIARAAWWKAFQAVLHDVAKLLVKRQGLETQCLQEDALATPTQPFLLGLDQDGTADAAVPRRFVNL